MLLRTPQRFLAANVMGNLINARPLNNIPKNNLNFETMKKHLLFFSLVLFSNLTIFSQEIKKFVGKYSDESISGDATYEYFENENFERIYHGSFMFTKGDPNAKLSSQIYREIKGKFNNNLKDGLWVYKTKKEEININFLMGIPNGVLLHKEFDLNTGKTIVLEKVNYKNGKMFGDFYYNGELDNESGIIRNVEISGKIDDNGYMDGNWSLKWKDIEDLRKYKEGVLYFRLVRFIDTGDILFKLDSTIFVNQIFTNINKSNMQSKVNNVTYEMKDSNNKEFDKDAITTFKRDYYLTYNSGVGIGKNYSSFVKLDNFIFVSDYWQKRLYGFSKGETKKLNNFYKRILTKSTN